MLRTVFSCGIRGYHEYKTIWVPVLKEVLPVKHESTNRHDRYAIAVMKRLPGRLAASVVGHLPREISRFTHFIIVHGAKVSCKVVDVHHRRSPLVQGGLEIPCEVTVEMEMTDTNSLAIDKYKQLVSEQYQEPVEGKFSDAIKRYRRLSSHRQTKSLTTSLSLALASQRQSRITIKN